MYRNSVWGFNFSRCECRLQYKLRGDSLRNREESFDPGRVVEIVAARRADFTSRADNPFCRVRIGATRINELESLPPRDPLAIGADLGAVRRREREKAHTRLGNCC